MTSYANSKHTREFLRECTDIWSSSSSSLLAHKYFKGEKGSIVSTLELTCEEKIKRNFFLENILA